ncbi:MAG: hypothetical protein KC459_06455, partial [Ruminococcus sp.]|nr:hypothetical protein [Ruminococcus sp.]
PKSSNDGLQIYIRQNYTSFINKHPESCIMMNKKTENYANSTYKVKNRYDTSARIVPFLFLKNVL